MAAGDDLDVGGVVKPGAAVVSQGRDLGQGCQDIDFSEGERGLADAAGFSRNGRAQLGKQAAFDLYDLFLGIENFGFVFFQLRSGEALGVDQGLLALVVGRGQVRIRLRDFEIVAKDRVELYLQRCDSGALALALLDLCQELFAVAAQVAELVEFGLSSGLNYAAVAEGDRGFRDDGAFNALAKIG